MSDPTLTAIAGQDLVTLTWTYSKDTALETNYVLYRSTLYDDPNAIQIYTTTNTTGGVISQYSFIDSLVNIGFQYYYFVIAANPGIPAAQSNIVTATPLPVPPQLLSNTSATGGTLDPLPPIPIDDAALDSVFQQLTLDVTGLPGAFVRPRWQTEVPKQPEPSINWCAIGVMEVIQDAGPWLTYDPANNVEHYWDHELIHVLASFYGPNSQSYARLLRAGLNVPQNTEELLPYMIRYIDCSPIRSVPELVNQQWIRRQDISLQFRRKVIMTYGVQNILIADINLIDDTGQVNDTIIVPPGSPIQP